MVIYRRAGMREGGLPLPLAFQYLIPMIWRACDLNLVMISFLTSKCQHFKVGMSVFQPFYRMKLKTSKFKVLAFWRLDLLKPAKISWPNLNHKLYDIIRIKYWKASGSGKPPSLIPALRKIAIYVCTILHTTVVEFQQKYGLSFGFLAFCSARKSNDVT